MVDEGKLTRAMAKSGAADKLSQAPSAPAHEPRTAPAAPLAPVAPAAQSRAVPDHWGPPSPDVALFHDGASAFASQVRGLRAKLMAMNDGVPPRILAVTSGSREEGKTTVSINLAAALAEIHAGRVALIDGDLLRPSLQEVLNVRVDEGLNEALADNLRLDGRIYETAIPNVDVVPSKLSPPSEGIEALLHQQCGRLLQLLKRSYAYIVVDTPPVLAGSPAATFAKNSDGVILVARLEKTPRHVVTRANDELANAGAKVLGCVLTHHRHHVPNFIYRFFGTTPANYYRYGHARAGRRPN
jgi:capsular exopolysaccharide synthesis family protein